MPRLMIFGDVHGEIKRMYDFVEEYEKRGLKIDGVVQIGDFGVFRSGTDWRNYRSGNWDATRPTLAIMGNHEDPEEVSLWTSPIGDIQLLPDGEIVEFLGVKIGGIWGNYSPVSYMNPDRVVQNRINFNSHRIAMHINRYAVENLLGQDGPIDMLITHDSARISFPPSFGPMDPMIGEILGLSGREEMVQARGCPGFDDLLRKFKPKKYYFGHLHHSERTRIGGTEAICLQAIQYSKSTCFDVVEF